MPYCNTLYAVQKLWFTIIWRSKLSVNWFVVVFVPMRRPDTLCNNFSLVCSAVIAQIIAPNRKDKDLWHVYRNKHLLLHSVMTCFRSSSSLGLNDLIEGSRFNAETWSMKSYAYYVHGYIFNSMNCDPKRREPQIKRIHDKKSWNHVENHRKTKSYVVINGKQVFPHRIFIKQDNHEIIS